MNYNPLPLLKNVNNPPRYVRKNFSHTDRYSLQKLFNTQAKNF